MASVCKQHESGLSAAGDFVGSSMGFIENGGIAAQSGTSGPCGAPSSSGPSEGRYPGFFGNYAPPTPVRHQERPLHTDKFHTSPPATRVCIGHWNRTICPAVIILNCRVVCELTQRIGNAHTEAAVSGPNLAATSAIQHLLRTLGIQHDVRLHPNHFATSYRTSASNADGPIQCDHCIVSAVEALW